VVQKALKPSKKERNKARKKEKLVLNQGGYQALAFTIIFDYLIM
jgi:hypothetical protein